MLKMSFFCWHASPEALAP